MARTAIAAVAITGFAVFLPLAGAVPAFADDCLTTPLLGGGLVGDTVCDVTGVVTGDGGLLPDLGSDQPSTDTPSTDTPSTGTPSTGTTPTTGGTGATTPVLIPVSPITIPSGTLPVTSGGSTSTPVTSVPVTAPVTTAPVVTAPVTTAPVSSTPVVSAPAASTPVASTPATSTPASEAPVVSAPATPNETSDLAAAPVASENPSVSPAVQDWAAGLLASSAWTTGEAIAAPANETAPAATSTDASGAPTAFTVAPVKTGMTADPSGGIPAWALAALVLLASLGGAGYLLRHDFRLLRRQA